MSSKSIRYYLHFLFLYESDSEIPQGCLFSSMQVLLLSKYYAGKMFAYNTSRHSPRLVLISLEIFVSEFQYYSAFFALSICSEVMFTFLLLLCLHSFLFVFFRFFHLINHASFLSSLYWCFPVV